MVQHVIIALALDMRKHHRPPVLVAGPASYPRRALHNIIRQDHHGVLERCPMLAKLRDDRGACAGATNDLVGPEVDARMIGDRLCMIRLHPRRDEVIRGNRDFPDIAAAQDRLQAHAEDRLGRNHRCNVLKITLDPTPTSPLKIYIVHF